MALPKSCGTRPLQVSHPRTANIVNKPLTSLGALLQINLSTANRRHASYERMEYCAARKALEFCPISVSPTQRSTGLLFGAADGVFWIMSLASASDRHFPELPFESNSSEGGLRLRGAFRLPGGTQAITVPFLRQAPALLQVQDATPRPIPLFAPTIHMLFRPEQKHGLSSKDNVLVPIAGRNGYVDQSLWALQSALFHV